MSRFDTFAGQADQEASRCNAGLATESDQTTSALRADPDRDDEHRVFELARQLPESTVNVHDRSTYRRPGRTRTASSAPPELAETQRCPGQWVR